MALDQATREAAANGADEVHKNAGEARNPLYALVGLNELILEQGKAAAERVQARFDAYRDGAIANAAAIRDELDRSFDEGRERANELQKALSETGVHDLQASLQVYLGTMARSYTSLAERGERILVQLSRAVGESPVVQRATEVGQGVVKQVEEAAEQAGERVRRTASAVTENAAAVDRKIAAKVATSADVAAKAATPVAEQGTIDIAQTAEVVQPTPSKTPARTTPARTTPARKVTGRKTPARQAPATAVPSRTSAAKATSRKTAAATSVTTKKGASATSPATAPATPSTDSE